MVPTRVAYGREAPARRHTFTQQQKALADPRKFSHIEVKYGERYKECVRC